MPQSGFTGISFPFRINENGGVAMSTTSSTEATHIVEAVNQILLTRPGERCMEYHFKSDVDFSVFTANDRSARSLVEYQIRQALKTLEDRIEVSSVNVISEDNKIIAHVTFKVIKYGTTYTTKAEVGDLNGSSDS